MSEINWSMVFSAAAVAGVYSLFTSLGGLPELSDSRSKTDNGEGGGE